MPGKAFLNVSKLVKKEMASPKGKFYKNYVKLFVYKCFDLIHKSYKKRSTGGKDKYGNSWRDTKRRKSGKSKYIMIDTERLINSFKAGRVGVTKYIPANKDQLVNIDDFKIEIGTNVEYTDFLKRSILPRNLVKEIVAEAHKYAIKSVSKEIAAAARKAIKK